MPVHAASRTYDLAGLAADPTRLSHVVAHDKEWLGDLGGLDVVHLQCHIGSDTISLARLGGRVTGVDFSPAALAVARDLADRGRGRGRFVESELYAVPDVLGAEFDLVYTGVGALNWLPDIAARARVVAGLLRPGGRLYVRDAHPMMNTVYADPETGDLRVAVALLRGICAALGERRDLHRRAAGELAGAIRVEPRVGRDRAGRDRRRAPGDRLARAPGVRVAGLQDAGRGSRPQIPPCPICPSGSRSCSPSRRSGPGKPGG